MSGTKLNFSGIWETKLAINSNKKYKENDIQIVTRAPYILLVHPEHPKSQDRP